MSLIHTLANKGWKPLPLPPGQKQSPPAGFTGYHGRQPTPDELDTWAEQYNTGLIDLAIGLPFDTIGIDIDHYDDKTGGTTLRQLEAELGPLPPTHKIGSRPGISGIRLYTVPLTENGEPLAFKANAGPHIDIIRPVHRYIKYAGTHPKTGNTYRLIDPDGEVLDLDELPAIDELPALPQAWVEHLRRAERTDADIALQNNPAPQLEGQMPAAVAEVLDQALERLPDNRHDTMVGYVTTLSHYRLQGWPGATEALEQLRNAFATEVGPQRAAEFDSALKWAEAAIVAEEKSRKPLYDERLRDIPERDIDDHAWMLETFPTAVRPPAPERPTNDLPTLAEIHALDPRINPPANNEWPEPAPIFTKADSPPFPVDVLPPVLHDAAHTVTQAMELPIDIGALVGIGCLSAVATWRNVRLDVNGSWIEGPNIYQVISMPPSAGKSPVFKHISGPLADIADEVQADSQRTFEAAEIERRVLQQRAKQLENTAAKGTDPAKMQEAIDANLAASEVELPPLRQLLADNATPEALGQLIADNGGNLAVLSSEGDFFDDLGRYAERGKAPDVSVPLKAWSGDQIIVNRIGGRKLNVRDPRLAMTFTVQPTTVHQLWGSATFSKRGLTHRVMVSQPDHNIGRRTFDAPELDRHKIDAWQNLLRRLWTMTPNAHTVQLSPTARTLFVDWQKDCEPMLAAEWQSIQSFIPKTHSTALRVALLLHLAEERSGQVDADCMTRAIEIGRYWIAHLLSLQDRDPYVEAPRRVLEWCIRNDITTFTLRELQQAGVLKRILEGNTRADLDPVIDDLIAAGWLKANVDGWQRLKRGSASPDFDVHPDVRRLM